MQLDIVRNYRQLEALKPEWDALAARRQIPMLDHAWSYACAHALHDETDLNVLILRDEWNTVHAIAPLVKSRRKLSPVRLEALGASTLGEPAGFLHRNTHALRVLYTHIARQGYPVVVDRFWGDSNDHATAVPSLAAHGCWIRRPCHGSGILEIEENWPDFLASRSPKRRYDHRRAQRRAVSFGGESYSIVTPTSSTLTSIFDLACDIETSGWKGERGTSILANPRLREFLKLYTHAVADAGTLRFHFLYLGKDAAAMAICAQSNDALWFLKIGYNEKFKACSPGFLLLANAYRYCVEQNLSRIEHLGSYETWLSSWTTYIRGYATLMYYPFNLGGARALAYDALRLAVSRTNNLVKRCQNFP